MTLILETPQSTIHRCPACGAQCAVEKDLFARVRDAGQHIQIACHKCDGLFQPLDSPSPVPVAARPSRPNANMRTGICRACGDSLSIPPLKADEAVMVECPHCQHLMQPDEVGHADALAGLPPPSQQPLARRKPARTWFALVLAGGLIAGFAAIAMFRITPPMATLFGLEIGDRPHFAVTEADFEAALDGADGAMLVTVTFANLGTAAGAPERVSVTLLDSAGNTVTTRPIAVREGTLAPGDSRTITARLSMPADGIEDMTVNIVEATRLD